MTDCKTKPVEISSVFIDHDIAGDKTSWIISEDEILVPKDDLILGDMLSVTYNAPVVDTNEVIMLSALHDNLYKTLDAELEFEFVRKDVTYQQNIEMIARAVNRWDRTFVVDEYYSFGLQNGRAYFAKTSYHEGGEDSFPYKQLLNLSSDDINYFFKDFSDEIVERLNLDPQTRQLRYNRKYQLRAEMRDNTASFYIKEVSNSVSQGIDFEWLPLFENIKLNVGFDEISNRNVSMDKIVSAPEPVNPLLEKGMFGVAIPNAFVRLYRYEVTPLDKDTDIKFYNNVEYSKQVSTDFSTTYRTGTPLKLNSSDSREDNAVTVQEEFQVDDKKAKVNENLKREDIVSLKLNNVDQERDKEYVDKFIDIKGNLTQAHEDSTLSISIDEEDDDVLGQQDQYFELGEGDGIASEFEIPDEAIQKLSLYPNARIGAVIVEIPDPIKYNQFDRVGVQENLDEFYTREEIVKQFRGKSLYLETDFRGEQDYIQMGILNDTKFTFEIDSEFLEANDSYDSIWKYNMANFIDDFGKNNPTMKDSAIENDLLPSDFNTIQEEDLNLDQIWSHPESIGYVVANTDPEDLEIIANSTLAPDFLLTSNIIPANMQLIINKGIPLQDLRQLLNLFQNVTVGVYKQFLLEASKKSLEFDQFFQDITLNFAVSGGLSTDLGGTSDQYTSFRETWLNYLEYNMHSSADAIDNRRLYTSFELNEKVFISLNEKKVSFNDPIDFNKKVVMRIYYENAVDITPRYKITDTFYHIPDNVKQLYTDTNGEKGPHEMFESFETTKFQQIQQGDITYVVVPNELLTDEQDQIYVDATVCSPFIEAEESVNRHAKLPLRKVSELLDADFATSQTGFEYVPNPDDFPSISGSPVFPISGASLEDYNRTFDYLAELNEIREGEWVLGSISGSISGPISGALLGTDFEYDYPKVYPTPDFASFTDGNVPAISDDNTIQETYFSGLLNNPVDDFLIDRYLDVSRWLNTDDNRLSDFNRAVLKNINIVMSRNRKYSDQVPLATSADPFNINSWFDGYYSGNITAWDDFWNEEGFVDNDQLDFGRYTGNPWGTQNSRKQMIDQLKQAGQNRFEGFTLFYIDLSELSDYNKTVLQGINSNSIDPDKYPITGTNQFIDNPFIDKNIKSYVPYTDTINNDGEVLFSATDFSKFTDISIEYPEKTRLSYPNLKDLGYEINKVLRPIVQGVDFTWEFNSSIMFNEDWTLPEGTFVCAEYEYVYDKNKVADNSTFKISQKATLGKSTGIVNQKFPNPDVFSNTDIRKSKVHKVWLDDYAPPSELYDILRTDEEAVEVQLNTDHVNDGFDMMIAYKSSNYLDLSVENKLFDNFSTKRDFKWATLTKDKFGYIKKRNLYGMELNDTLFPSETIWKKTTLTTLEDGSDLLTTSGTVTSKETLYGLKRGLPEEDTVELLDFDKANNFDCSIDIFFDKETIKDFMTTGILFRGGFNFVNGARYFNEYYSIVLGSEKFNIGLISVATNKDGVTETQELAKVNDANAILKRDTWYTLRFSVIKDVVKIFFNVRNQKEKFYFKYNLNTGKIAESADAIMDEILDGGLGVTYEVPKTVLRGNRIGLSLRSDKIYFSNLKIKGLEENNLTMNDSFVVKKYDEDIENLSNIYKLNGQFKKLRKTTDGYVYMLIDNSLFARRNDGVYIIHSKYVEDFEIHGSHIYVIERVTEGRVATINIYVKIFEPVSDARVNGKGFINEPMLAYINDFDREVIGIEKVRDDILLTFDNNTRAGTWAEYFEYLWSQLGDDPWDEQ